MPLAPDPTLQALFAATHAARDEIIAFHQAIVRFNTVNTGKMPTGNETPCCLYIQQRLAAEGIAAEVIESAPARGNLVARLAGTSNTRSLLLMSHLDVVPVEDVATWKHPPFDAVLSDGRIWGRGSDDAKSLATTGFFTAVLLKRAGIALGGDLVYTATADEESGGFYGYGWLAEHVPDKIRCTYALNEGGGMPLLSPDDRLLGISLGEKGRCEVTITIEGASAHASQPWSADNALVKAARVIDALAAYQPAVDVSHVVFDAVPRMLPGTPRPTVANLDSVLDAIGKVHRQSAHSLKALSRMTVTPTVLHAGVKSNSIPASAVLVCDSRTLPGQDGAYVQREVERIVSGISGVTVHVAVWARSTQSAFDTPFTRALGNAYTLATGLEVELAASLTAGFTDSQYVRPLGVAAYGFSPIDPKGERTGRGVHGVDEFTEVDTLVTRIKVYLAAAYLTLVKGLD